MKSDIGNMSIEFEDHIEIEIGKGLVLNITELWSKNAFTYDWDGLSARIQVWIDENLIVEKIFELTPEYVEIIEKMIDNDERLRMHIEYFLDQEVEV